MSASDAARSHESTSPIPSPATPSASEWVATLPDFEENIPPSTSSIIPRFSLFSLFTRTPSAPRPTDALLEPLHDLVRVPSPSSSDIRRALRSLGDYVRHVQKSSGVMTPPELAQALGRIGEAYVVAVNVLVRGEATSRVQTQTQTQTQTEELFDAALAGAFEVYRHHPREGTTREILAAPFEPTALLALLCPLFEGPRILLQALGHAARGHPLKAGSGGGALSPAEVALQVESEALVQSHRLEAFALQLGSLSLSGLEAYPFPTKQRQTPGKAGAPPSAPASVKVKKKTKAEIKKEAQDRAGRPVRIALEAELLRAELAMSMATARIEDIKRRAGGDCAGEGSEREGAEDVGGGERSASSAPSRGGSGNRKRRALTDESEFEMGSTPSVRATPLPDVKPSVGAQDSRSQGEDHGMEDNHVRWEDRAESALLRCLVHARDLVQTHRAELLTEHIQRSDWLDDGARPIPSLGGAGAGAGVEHCGLSPVHSRFSAIPPTPIKNGAKDYGEVKNGKAAAADDEDDDEDDAASTSSLSSHSPADSAEDLSHPCPLRALFRLHDRYEEQRLAVWMGLASAVRGKMGAYMRGRDGRVGAAWDALGLGLLIEYDSDALEAYGLGLDKYDKWVELAWRKNAQKIRKRGRKTM